MLKKWFISKMKEGRQGTGYRVFTFWSKWFFDVLVIYISKDTHVPYHTDKVEGKEHHRINLELGAKHRTTVVEEEYNHIQDRLYKFRPDLLVHKVDTGESDTWIFSIGWTKSL